MDDTEGNAVTAIAIDPTARSTAPRVAMTQPRVLLVGTDTAAIEVLAGELMRRDMQVMLSCEAGDGLLALGTTAPDVVLLTPGVAAADAAAFLRTLRRRHSTPVIAGVDPAATQTATLLLDAGATACVAWPFRLAELLPLLRAAGTAEPLPDVLRIGGIEVRVPAHEVRVDGRRVEFPLREFELLVLLMTHAGTVVTRQQIKDTIWGIDYAGATNTVTVHIARIRQRLGDSPDRPSYVEAVRGLGYRFTTPEGR